VRLAEHPSATLAGIKFADIDFSNAVITASCNFCRMQIAGVPVADLFAAGKRTEG
jgi:hypothetical protein